MSRLARDTLINGIIASGIIPRPIRWRALRLFGMDIERCAIAGNCWFGGTDVRIGVNSFINYGCFFDGAARIDIGARCDVGMEVMFCTGTHRIGTSRRRAGDPIAKPIVVRDGCWIGARATLLPGVTVGEGSVIGAAALVATDCEPRGVYAGVPAKLVRTLE